MMNVDLNEDERRMLWVALNVMQSQGLHNLGNQLQKLKDNDSPELKIIIGDWVRQGYDEYNLINNLKAKLLKKEVVDDEE